MDFWENSMIKIDKMRFGWIIVGGKKHRHYVVVFPSTKVKRRRGGILMFGSHFFKRKEFEELCKHEIDTIVIGTSTIMLPESLKTQGNSLKTGE